MTDKTPFEIWQDIEKVSPLMADEYFLRNRKSIKFPDGWKPPRRTEAENSARIKTMAAEMMVRLNLIYGINR